MSKKHMQERSTGSGPWPLSRKRKTQETPVMRKDAELPVREPDI
jgi:hypothetical protein